MSKQQPEPGALGSETGAKPPPTIKEIVVKTFNGYYDTFTVTEQVGGTGLVTTKSSHNVFATSKVESIKAGALLDGINPPIIQVIMDDGSKELPQNASPVELSSVSAYAILRARAKEAQGDWVSDWNSEVQKRFFPVIDAIGRCKILCCEGKNSVGPGVNLFFSQFCFPSVDSALRFWVDNKVYYQETKRSELAFSSVGEKRLGVSFSDIPPVVSLAPYTDYFGDIDPLKYKAAELINLCETLKSVYPERARTLSLAQTNIEQGIMWAQKDGKTSHDWLIGYGPQQ